MFVRLTNLYVIDIMRFKKHNNKRKIIFCFTRSRLYSLPQLIVYYIIFSPDVYYVRFYIPSVSMWSIVDSPLPFSHTGSQLRLENTHCPAI